MLQRIRRRVKDYIYDFSSQGFVTGFLEYFYDFSIVILISQNKVVQLTCRAGEMGVDDFLGVRVEVHEHPQDELTRRVGVALRTCLYMDITSNATVQLGVRGINLHWLVNVEKNLRQIF